MVSRLPGASSAASPLHHLADLPSAIAHDVEADPEAGSGTHLSSQLAFCSNDQWRVALA